jgi:2-desacetyl-2-hydroxyethyl bacteriochlorophyllide A dehydrogenase
MDKELWFLGPNQVELRDQPPQHVPPGHVRVQGLYSAVSHGTEALLVTGSGPASFDPSLDAPAQATYPRRYGYAWVGRVQTPGSLCEELVFALQPHGTAHVLEVAQMRVLPKTLPPRRATLAAAMETALNAVWDAELKVGERVVVFGAGTIGLLVSHVATIAGAQVTVVEPRVEKHGMIERLGARAVLTSAYGLSDKFDAVFEVSGQPAVLDDAIARCDVEARIVVVSFYGAKTAPVHLGDRFHRRRLRLVSSQVSTIPSALKSRFDFARRFEVVCRLLEDARLDALTEHVVPFVNAVETYALMAQGKAASQVLFEY